MEKTKYRQHNNIEKRDQKDKKQIRNVVSAHVYTDNDDISQFLNSISQFNIYRRKTILTGSIN